jgi:alkanesulfonate monooxygenase SsuD/methylene tetrahydromethanopterin reductase-like flavin-dependent oxidoreductase (luciferase family)
MSLTFGVTVLPDPPYTRMIGLMQLAESHGFEYAWTYDSHVLWQESFPVFALVAERLAARPRVANAVLGASAVSLVVMTSFFARGFYLS